MPSGGLSMYGSGLQLQQATPGNQQSGNFNIAGQGLAGNFSTANGLANAPEAMGHGNTLNPTNQSVTFGSNNNSDANGSAYIMFGHGCTATGAYNVAMGFACQAGAIPSLGFPWNVAIGSNCTAGTTAADGGYRVAMGTGCNAIGNQNLALGTSVNVTNVHVDNTADCIGIGIGIGITGTQLGSVAIGYGINLAALSNQLVIGRFGAGTPAQPTSLSNQIVIGNSSQTNVLIGPYTIGPGNAGGLQKIADAAYTALPTDGTVIYTSITAARVVTLPAANAVPAGYRLLVLDSSGSASGVNTITLTRVGTDTINGGTTSAIVLAYGVREIVSDGVSKWTVVRSI